MRWSDISAQTTPPNVLKLNDFSNLPAVQSSPVNLKKSRISEWWNRTHVLRDPMINNVTDITLPSILHSQLEIIKPSRAEAMFPGVPPGTPSPPSFPLQSQFHPWLVWCPLSIKLLDLYSFNICHGLLWTPWTAIIQDEI